jgi:hypothetical protein
MTKYQGDMIVILLSHMLCLMIWDYTDSDLSILWPMAASIFLVKLYDWGNPDRKRKRKKETA